MRLAIESEYVLEVARQVLVLSRTKGILPLDLRLVAASTVVGEFSELGVDPIVIRSFLDETEAR